MKIKHLTILAGLCLLQLVTGMIDAQTWHNLITNSENRQVTTFNGKWKYIVDTYESGYYDYRRQVRDQQAWQNTAEALYLAHKAANKGERVEYDFVKDRIGFRTLAVKGREILVNGKPVFLRGISIHEENPLRGGRAYSAKDARVLLEWARELGCNYVRLAHYPHNENMVRHADELGIMVWSEFPVYWTIQWENQETYNNAENQLLEMITRDKKQGFSNYLVYCK